MRKDLYPQFATLNQRQIGEHFLEGSHVIGKWLKAAGLRLPSGEPSQAAIDGGFVEQVDLGDGRPPFWSWNKKVIPFLEKQGHMRPLIDEPDSGTGFIGPFTARQSGTDGDGYELPDSRGIVGVWVRGEGNAKEIVGLMNLGHKLRGMWK